MNRRNFLSRVAQAMGLIAAAPVLGVTKSHDVCCNGTQGPITIDSGPVVAWAVDPYHARSPDRGAPRHIVLTHGGQSCIRDDEADHG